MYRGFLLFSHWVSLQCFYHTFLVLALQLDANFVSNEAHKIFMQLCKTMRELCEEK